MQEINDLHLQIQIFDWRKDLKMAQVQDKQARTNGRWTKAEHQKFLLGLQLYGKNWKKIEQLVGTRTGSQIRSHAQKFFLKTKRPEDQNEKSQQGHESPQLNNSSAVISNNVSNSQENQQYSYFMNKILKASSGQIGLNFWDQFIDMGNSKCEQQSQGEIRRKDSFVAFDNCNDSKQETAFSCYSFLGEYIV